MIPDPLADQGRDAAGVFAKPIDVLGLAVPDEAAEAGARRVDEYQIGGVEWAEGIMHE